MEHLDTTVRHDHEADVTVITVTGSLTMASAPQVRRVLSKCLAECPVGVVVDLRPLVRVDPIALTVFRAAASAHRRIMPEVPVLVCADDPTFAERTALGAGVSVVASAADGVARAAERGVATRRFAADLPYSAQAVPEARAIVARACASWALDAAALQADMVASELVTNAYRHARSASRLEVRRQGPYIVVTVTDHSPDAVVPPPIDAPDPHAGNGRGLWIVGLYSTSWGVRTRPDGKTVWAAIRVTPARQHDLGLDRDQELAG